MKRILYSLAIATLGLTACTGGQTGSIPVTSVNPVQTSTLQFAIGTANINGVAGTNIVSTLRQPNGLSAALVNTPTLSGPLAFGLAGVAGSATTGQSYSTGGPTVAEVAGKYVGGTTFAQTTPPNQAGGTVAASARTTLGLFGGLSATGFFQLNSSTAGTIATTGTPNGSGPSIIPYRVPMYSPTAVQQPGLSAAAIAADTAATFTPWIGPPAFAGASGIGSRDGTYSSGLQGAAAGITVLDFVTPGAGTYTMSVQIALGFDANGNAVYGNTTKTAALAAPATCLGGCGVAIPAPVIVPAAGGATITATLPAGATGAILLVTDLGPATGTVSCYPGTLPNNSATFTFPASYTVAVTASGTATLPANLGPRPSNSGTTTPTICSAAANNTAAGAVVGGDQVQVQMVAYNYGLLALVPALNTVAAPAMPTGDADIAISAKSAIVVAP